MGSKSYSILSHCPDLSVKQTKRGWLRELMGCEAKTEFNIRSSRNGHSMFASETSSDVLRFLLPKTHPWDMTLWHGRTSTAPSVEILEYNRPLRMPFSRFKCFCHQTVRLSDTSGKFLGETIENFFCCVPNFDVRDGNGDTEYVISQPTCLDGTFVDFFAEGVFNLRQPFYVYEKGTQHIAGQEVAKIVKVWSGLSKELCTDADNFEISFNQIHNPASKARLVGSLFLLNQLYFEGKSSFWCL